MTAYRLPTEPLLILATLTLAACDGSLGDDARHRVEQMLANLPVSPAPPISAADLATLPSPVQKYLKRSQVVGKRPSRFVRLEQTGRIKTAPGEDWTELTAVEYYRTDLPSFVWLARTTGFPTLQVIDSFHDGHGQLAVELPPFGKLVDATGPALDEGELMRYLQEMIWFPTALAGKMVQWQLVSETAARATLEHGSLTVSGVFHFDANGDVVNFVAAERPRIIDDVVTRERWSTPISAYREIGGYRLPVAGAGVWHLAEGDLRYVEVEVTKIEWDVMAPY